jgi:cytochrome P450
MVRLFRTEHRVDTDVDISSVAFWRQPFHVRDVAFGRLRAERPVSWHPALETPGYPKSKHHEAGFWAVTTAEDIAYASRHHELFSSELGQVNLRPAPFRVDPNMLVLDPPAHDSLRRVVSAAFTPKAVARLERTIERRSKQIVARAAARGEFDFVRHVAAQLPLRTIADLFGLPPSEHDSFVVAADAYVGSGFPGRASGGYHDAGVPRGPGRVLEQPVHRAGPLPPESARRGPGDLSGERGARRPAPQRRADPLDDAAARRRG